MSLYELYEILYVLQIFYVFSGIFLPFPIYINSKK